jgi:UDP-N-acetyl-2-amino-2-deoxyglucuronate dehydrogenase
MKFGIIGAGMIGNFHAKAITEMNGGTLHSVFDVRAEGAERLASQYGVKAYSNIDEFLSDPELEIVTIGTPSGAHLDPALAALNAGKHVICEKPLEINPARIDEMMEAAKANGKTLAAVLNRRFHPALEAFKEAAETGRFGKITSASCYVKWWRTQEYYDSGAWRGTWALDGGGALMNQSIHTVDTLLHIAGPVKAVRASTGLIAHERIEVEDIVVATLEFESGAFGVIEATTAAWSSTGHPARVQVCGTQGSVFLADEAFEVWDFAEEVASDAEVKETLMKGSAKGLGANDPTAINVDGHIRNFEETVNAIHENREPTVGASEARKAVAVICAVYESARNGGARVEL